MNIIIISILEYVILVSLVSSINFNASLMKDFFKLYCFIIYDCTK